MLSLHVVQAEFGDCLLLEYGSAAAPHFTLIDGGPPTTYERHLRTVLGEVVTPRALDLVVLSHVDNDHVVGLVDYVTDLRTRNVSTLPPLRGLWHNSFRRSLDPNADIQTRLQALIVSGRSAGMTNAGMAVNGIPEGNSLRLAAQALSIPINAGFPNDLIVVDTAPAAIPLENLTIRIVGPTQANLDELRAEWEEWLDTHEAAIGTDDPLIMANADRSIPNLSSIMLHVEADGKTILFTGDGRSDHLLDGLEQTGLLDAQGRLHLDVLKLPHHGSDRNVTKKFFKTVTAQTYVASANGKDDNPDLATLIWIVEAAREQQRDIKLVVTNRTPSVQKLLDEYAPTDYGYKIDVLSQNLHRLTLALA